MARKTITFTAETEKFFVANPKQLAGYQATIQNNTGQMITITVTNEDKPTASSTYVTVASSLVISSGEAVSFSEPYQGWKLTAGAPATGTVEITEMG